MNISKVEFGSLLTYTPRGDSEKAKGAKTAMINLKNDNVLSSGILTSEYIVQAMAREINTFPFADYFNSNAVLVPAPKSSLLKPDTLWVPQRITTALIRNGLGKSSEACLERVTAVARSSGQTVGANRPKALKHYESMRVKELLFKPKEIVLVDDVITRGATILGGVNRLSEAFPDAKIRAFAMMRTISNAEEFSDVEDPCIGTITMYGEDTSRVP